MPSSHSRQEKLELPAVIHPPNKLCFQVEIPDERGYLAAFFGAIGQLAQWRTWELDAAHSAKEVAAVWRDIYFSLKAGTCAVPCVAGGADEGEQMLRVNPDNPCELQEFCGGNWVHFWGPDDCAALGGGANPSGGGPLSPGECREYSGTLEGQSVWLLPVPLNPGDTVQVTSISGAWTDGSGLWFCPDGQHYLLGACADGITTSGSDPMPSAPHASLVFQSDSVWYSPLGTPVGIPSGATANSNAQFQMNDPSLSGNGGTISFKVKVCSQAATPVLLTYDEGSGPASVEHGSSFVVTAEDTGFFQCHELFRLKVHFAPCVHVKVLSLSGYTSFACEGDNVDYTYKDCGGTDHFCRVSDGCIDPPANWPDTDATYIEIASRTAFTIVVSVS